MPIEILNTAVVDFGQQDPLLPTLAIHKWLKHGLKLSQVEIRCVRFVMEGKSQTYHITFVNNADFVGFLNRHQSGLSMTYDDQEINVSLRNAGKSYTFVTLFDIPFELKEEMIRPAIEKYGKTSQYPSKLDGF